MQSTMENPLPAASTAGEVCIGDRKLHGATERKTTKVPEVNKTVLRPESSTHLENFTLTNFLGFIHLFSFV